MIWALRVAFWVQALLGLGLSRILAGMAPADPERNAHLVVGLVAAILAITVLRPVGPDDTFATMARFFPLLPLAVGLGIRSGAIGGQGIFILHILLGLAAIGLVEASIARRRRALGGADASR